MVQIGKSHTCTMIKYTIAFYKENYQWCELFLKGSQDGTDKIDIYYNKEKSCPTGFIKLNGTCQCSQFLTQFGVCCNISDQTILRPANFWISPLLHGNLYFYVLSLHCPFHYCLPHSSHLITSPLLTHSVSLTDLVYCVDTVNKVSVLYLVPFTVNNVQVSTCF